jgi:hypothetical protein
MGQEIRTLLVLDQSLFREGLGHLLRDELDFQVVGSCACAKEALRALEREPADIVLVDYDLGEEQVFPLPHESSVSVDKLPGCVCEFIGKWGRWVKSTLSPNAGITRAQDEILTSTFCARQPAAMQSILNQLLILRRPLDMINDEDFHGAFCWFQLQP